MNYIQIIHALGSIGFFSSRAFLPAFMTASLCRWGYMVPGLEDVEFFVNLENTPVWFTHGLTVTVLGLLSALEVAATKSPEARELLDEVGGYTKPALSALTMLGVMSAADATTAEQVIQPQEAGFLGMILLPVVVFGVIYGTRMRGEVMSIFTDADADDDIGLQGLISWAEDLWVIIGLVLLVVFPIVMLLLIGAVSGLFWLIGKHRERLDEQSRVPCQNCGHMIYQCAVACPSCSTPVEHPHAVGFFGNSRDVPTKDPKDHPLRLVEKHRCPVCATRFEQRVVPQTCEACGHQLMADPAFAQRYLDYVGGRFAKVILVCGLLSFIPVVGLIPGVIYYRVKLVAPFRRYLPIGSRFLLKWLVRIAVFLLIGMQWIPILGVVSIPLMATLNFLVYRGAFSSRVSAASPD